MTTLTPPATIAFIGLGMMGRPMAKRLVEAGFFARKVVRQQGEAHCVHRQEADRAEQTLRVTG